MMKKFAMLGIALAMAAGVAVAAEVKSGLQPGDSVGAFTVEKVCGNPNDGIADGKSLCYRCNLGSKPVVMVFSRKADANLAALIKELDAKLPQHKDKKLSAFVNLIGSKDAAELKSTAKKFGESNKSENVAIVVPSDSENGPEDYKLNPDAEVTVLIYKEGKVAANHAFAAGKLDKTGIASVIADTAKILN
jgi:hypothetical protein